MIVEKKSRTTGKTYYYNTETKVSTWKRPQEFKAYSLETENKPEIQTITAPRPLPVYDLDRSDNPVVHNELVIPSKWHIRRRGSSIYLHNGTDYVRFDASAYPWAHDAASRDRIHLFTGKRRRAVANDTLVYQR